MEVLLPMSVLLMLGLGGVGFLISRAIRIRLQARFPEVWQGLGSPGSLLNGSIRASLRGLRFVWRSEYLALRDGELSGLCRASKWVTIAYVVSFVLVVVSGAAQRGARDPEVKLRGDGGSEVVRR